MIYGLATLYAVATIHTTFDGQNTPNDIQLRFGVCVCVCLKSHNLFVHSLPDSQPSESCQTNPNIISTHRFH